MDPVTLQPLPNFDLLTSEIEAYELFIAGYIGSIVRAGRGIPDDKWNWSFSERTPSAREICEHTYMWLFCDRQQMTEPDRAKHLPTADLPKDKESMLQLLHNEACIWQNLVRAMTPDQLNQELVPWEGEKRTVRSFFFHMAQNIIYKSGQIRMIHFELGLDGDGPYKAPYPDLYYDFAETLPWPSPRG